MSNLIERKEGDIRIESINELLEEMCLDPAFIEGFESSGYFTLIQALTSLINEISYIVPLELYKYTSEQFQRIEQIANLNRNSQAAKFCMIVLLVQMYSLVIKVEKKFQTPLEEDFDIEVQENLRRFIEMLTSEISRRVKDYFASDKNKNISEIGNLERELAKEKIAIHKQYQRRGPNRFLNMSTDLPTIISEAGEIREVTDRYMSQINIIKFNEFYRMFLRKKEELDEYLILQTSSNVSRSFNPFKRFRQEQ